MTNKIILFFIFLFILLFNNAKSIEILSSNIVNKNVNVLGVDLSYALVDIEFDTPLYRYDSLSCPQFTCPFDTHGGNETIDCSCDYTTYTTDPLNTNKNRSSICQPCPEESYGIRYDSGNWEVLELDTVYYFTAYKEKPLKFRHKASGLGCKGLFFKVTAIDGYGLSYIGASPNAVYQRYSSEYKPQRHTTFNICPSDNWDTTLYYTYTESWTRDTYFMSVSAMTDVYNFSIVLHSSDVPELPETQPTCQPVSSDYQCINNGKVVYGLTEGEMLYYSFDVPEAGIYTIAAPCMYQNVMYYLSTTNMKPDFNQFNWALLEDYENYLVLYLEATTLYIGVEPSYATNFTFSISNFHTLYQYSLESMPSIQAGAYALTGTSNLFLPNATYSLPYFTGNDDYSIIYPQTDITPLWPVPALFFSSVKFDYSKIYNVLKDFNSFKPNSYQVAVLLSSGIGSSNQITNQNYSSVLESKLGLLSTIFDKNGNPFNFTIEFKEKKMECNNLEFNNILKLIDQLEKVFFNISDLDQLNSYRYGLDSLTMSDSWIACSNNALQFLEQKVVYKNVMVKNCAYNSNDPEYETDPCCNSVYSYYECCNPSNVSKPFYEYSQVNKTLVDGQCSSLDCTSSVLSEYGASLSSIDSCAVPDSEPTRIQLETTTILRQCQKQTLTSPYCSNDSDCENYGLGYCDLYSRTCLPDFETVDKSYVKCVLNGLSKSTLFSLLKGSTIVDDSVVDKVYNQNQKEDCIGQLGIRDRSTYVWATKVEQSKIDCYPSLHCLDETCLTYHDTCLDSLYQFWDLHLVSNYDNCTNWGHCPYLECFENSDGVFIDENGVEQLCKDVCDGSFCGYCSNNETQCYNVTSTFGTQAACESQSLCLLSNGQYLTGLTEDQCINEQGFCTSPCGYECKTKLADGLSKCVASYPGMTNSSCASISGAQWVDGISACLYPSATTMEECSAISNSYWVNCTNRNEGECVGPINNLDLCYLEEIPCKNEQECLSQSGTCSDQFYFDPTQSNPNYQFGQGKCVTPHGLFQSYYGCQAYYSNDSPNGCYPIIPSNLTKDECLQSNGEWWVPAMDEATCVAQFGCKVLEDPKIVQNLPFNYYFNEMNQQQCEGCFESFNQWTNKFEWTPAKWLPGVFKPAQWYQDKLFIPNTIETVFNYEMFYKNVMIATKTNVADLFRSEAYCRFERLQSNLNSITCSCSGPGGAQCFEESSPLLGQVKSCADENSAYQFDYGFVNFTENSIDQGCQSISFSQISREIYLQVQPQSLASNFVAYKKPPGYAIVNSKDSIIGTLLGDGVMIKSQDGIKSLTICLEYIKNQYNSDYPIFDFASQTLDQSTPKPLQVETFTLDYLISTTGITIECLCANITRVSNENPIYFPINRIDGWVDAEKKVFEQSTRSMMYTLGALFLAVALWGFYEIGLIIIARVRGNAKKAFQLVHLLIIIVTLFISIRCVYFFLLPNGNLSNSPVVDYILVVLPTFIYFTAFTIIIVLWYVIVYLILKKNRSTENLSGKLYKIVFLVNSILYLLFIAIVLVFQYTKDKKSNDCGTRIIIDTSQNNAQKGVSYAYAIIQAVISLVIASAFAYLGTKLYKAMRITKIKIGSKSNHEKKIFILTSTISVSFVLHCIFVLVMVFGVNSIVFSFVGLIITELIPSISILYCYDQRHPIRQKSSSGEGSNNSDKGKNSGGSSNRMSTMIMSDSSNNFRSSTSLSPSDFSNQTNSNINSGNDSV